MSVDSTYTKIKEQYSDCTLLCLQVADTARSGNNPQECDTVPYQREHSGAVKVLVAAVNFQIRLFMDDLRNGTNFKIYLKNFLCLLSGV